MALTTRSPLASFFLRLGRQVWVRAALFTVIGVIVALAAGLLGPLLPFEFGLELGQDAVGSLLQIIATAMLTVSTFSVTAMVTAFSSATTTATPRSTPLLIADTTSQNAVSTFVGAFTFSLVGIVALSTGYYHPQGRAILFVSTLVIIGIVVFTLLRWISHLSTFGRMADVIDRVEKAATASLEWHAERPTLGARASTAPPSGAVGVHADEVGYVTHVDVAGLDRIARQHDLEVHVHATPGRIADARVPVAFVVGRVDDAVETAVRRAFRIEHHRTFEQDPRFGVIALTEIGSRALSAATNDPGTAIEVIAALQRVFSRAFAVDTDPSVDFERVFLPAPRLADLVDDAFRPLARDGAADVEVQVRLQKCLASLAASAPDRAEVFRDAARAALERSRRALDRTDARTLRAATRGAWSPRGL
ncbi:putative membrane protein [Microbacterium sp. AG157]|uniref:DUF2254 domain-containing protein n=1 Tax=Microbacterium sp. AG157 TaxID=2183993 RepID=UPI000E230580|nr:DUF2254 domain-containing protein [Microbacterium sp. AG157]REC97513.1 putative membrane protein [Microbacterium sp. AG157]